VRLAAQARFREATPPAGSAADWLGS